MAGLDPATWRGTVLEKMAGSSPAMTTKRCAVLRQFHVLECQQ
jgi:hypothetical protein